MKAWVLAFSDRRSRPVSGLQRPEHRGAISQQRAGLPECEPRKSRVRCGWFSVPEIAEEITLNVALREELLIAAETRPTRGKEFLVDFRVIETGHRTAVEPERTRRHNQ